MWKKPALGIIRFGCAPWLCKFLDMWLRRNLFHFSKPEFPHLWNERCSSRSLRCFHFSHCMTLCVDRSKTPSNHIGQIILTIFRKNACTQPVSIKKFGSSQTLWATVLMISCCTGFCWFFTWCAGYLSFAPQMDSPLFSTMEGCPVRTTTQALVLWLPGGFSEWAGKWREDRVWGCPLAAPCLWGCCELASSLNWRSQLLEGSLLCNS